jgi:cytochrome P450
MGDAKSDPISFDLIDPRLNPDPDACPTWETLRTERPVAWIASTENRSGFWALTKYRDIAAAYRSEKLSSAQGNMLATLTLEGRDPAAEQMLVVTEPPRHTHLRKLLQGGFNAAMGQLEESLQEAASHLVAAAIEREEVEFASEVAAQIPLLAVCELLGVPDSEQQRMLDMTLAAMAGDGTGPSEEAAGAARREILIYYAQLQSLRRRFPAEDLVTLMVEAEVEGKPLSTKEIILNCYNILIGGDETSRLSTVGGLLALIENPSQWDRLKADPDALNGAIQEILRWTTPATHMCRLATDALTIQGEEIAPGEIVTLWNLSANRDEEIFEEPYSFEISRSPNKHLTFGTGRHACLGAALTRIEQRAILSALLEQVDQVELLRPPVRLNTTFLAGVGELHVRLSSG